ncbi:MAG TPA: hypothetical protein VHW47_01740, partial [Acidimicrobiales bacterium]|nr:hypothetical protein [Acidimicrobiales bacterium]
AWMWAGGLLIGLGGLLALVPGRRRRPTDPVSSLSPVVAEAGGPGGNGRGDHGSGGDPDRGVGHEGTERPHEVPAGVGAPEDR